MPKRRIRPVHQHSYQFHLIEWFEKTDADTILWTATYEDPVYYTEPLTITLRLKPEPNMPPRPRLSEADPRWITRDGAVKLSGVMTPSPREYRHGYYSSAER